MIQRGRPNERGFDILEANGIPMDDCTFERFRDLIYDRSGITLGPTKKALVTSRIGKRMRTLGIEEAGQYLRAVLEDPDGDELVQLLDAISTNVTSFFREPQHFHFLERRFGELQASGQKRFRIWCAAASTGEEPYTIAMTICDRMQVPPPDVKILATDISTRVLAVAREGQYDEERVQGIPESLRARWFPRVGDGATVLYRAQPALRNLLSFARLNLIEQPYPMKGPFDLIFCRNVMIYFDPTVKQGLLREFYRLLRPDGHLIVGHAESLTGLDVPFTMIEPAVYRRA